MSVRVLQLSRGTWRQSIAFVPKLVTDPPEPLRASITVKTEETSRLLCESEKSPGNWAVSVLGLNTWAFTDLIVSGNPASTILPSADCAVPLSRDKPANALRVV